MILDIVVFMVGVHAMIEWLAASYRYIDLWYRIKDFWIGITTKLLLISAIIGVIYYLLPHDLRIAFVAGLATYLILHILLFWLGRLLVVILGSKN